MYKTILFVICLPFLAGCSTVFNKIGYVEKEAAKQALIQANQEKQVAVENKEKEISAAKDALINQIKSNFQNTSNFLYGAKLASDFKLEKNRLDDILDLRLKTAMGYAPAPTPEAVLSQMESLKEELDELKVSNAELKKRYDAQVIEAQAAKAAEQQKEKELKDKEKEKLAEIEKYNKLIAEKQENLNKINDSLLIEQQQKLEKAKDEAALKRTLIYILTVLGVLFAVGAYFLRSIECVIGAGICVGLAMVVPLIKPWMLFTGLAVCMIGISVPFIRKYLNEKKIADNAVGAIQELRNESEQIYKEKLRPKLTEWFGDDKVLHGAVEKKLKELNLK